MIRIKLEKSKTRKIIFKLKVDDEDKKNILLKRALMESKIIKGRTRYDYEVPLRFFVPICNNIDRKNLKLDRYTILSYLEFSDYYDENYYSDTEATAKYMRKWRERRVPRYI